MARLERLAARIVLLYGWNRYLVAFGAGLLSALSMAPVDFFPILFLTLPVFVWVMDGVYADDKNGWFKAVKTPFLCGWWFGFGYFLMGLWWIGNAFLVDAEEFVWLLPFAVILLPAGLAVFWGLAGILSRLIWSDSWLRCLSLAFAFGAMEFLRGYAFTGLPWNTLGYAAMPFVLWMQSASVIGVYGVTVVAIAAFSIPLTVLSAPSGLVVSRKFPLLLVVVLFAGHTAFGAFRLSQNPTEFVSSVSLRLMQPNIKQADKFDIGNEKRIIDTYLELSASTGKDGKTLEGTNYLIWPESAFPFLLTERRDVLGSIGKMLPPGTQLITGAMRAEPGVPENPYGNVYNSVFLIEENGEIIEAADKVHLVPFGEYLPYQSLLESLGFEQLTRQRGGFTAGSDRTLLAKNSAFPALPLICYEIIFSGEVLQQGLAQDQHPEWIVNLTNDGWFGLTPGPYQHLRQSIIRGVEEGLPIVRVANTGFSVVSDPMGRILYRLGLNEKGIIDSALPKKSDPTLFSRYRHLPLYILLLVCLLGGLGGMVRRRHSK